MLIHAKRLAAAIAAAALLGGGGNPMAPPRWRSPTITTVTITTTA
jgi:hypothetical protein